MSCDHESDPTKVRRAAILQVRATNLAAALGSWAVLAESARRRGRKVTAYETERRRQRRQVLGGPRVRITPKIGRNDPCPCGSGRKFKRCCIDDGVYNSTMERDPVND